MCRYSQDNSATPGQLNPQDLQVGQSVWDNEGKEQVVVESPQGEAQKTLMPKDQQGQPIPQVTTVDDPDIQTQYSLQPTTPGSPKQVQQPTARRIARMQECPVCGREVRVDDHINYPNAHAAEPGGSEICEGSWILLEPSYLKSAGYCDEDDPYYDSPEGDTRMVDDPGGIESWKDFSPGGANPEDDNALGINVRYDPGHSQEDSRTAPAEEMGPLRTTDRRDKKTLREGFVAALLADVGGMDEFAETSSPLTHGESWGEEEDALRFGEAGYTEIMNSIKDMLEADYEVIDIMLNIGELYPRELAQRVLSEARKRGIL
jgi:hypothetical protein